MTVQVFTSNTLTFNIKNIKRSDQVIDKSWKFSVLFPYTLSPIKNKKVDLQNKSFKYQQLHLGDGLYKVVKVVLHRTSRTFFNTLNVSKTTYT